MNRSDAADPVPAAERSAPAGDGTASSLPARAPQKRRRILRLSMLPTAVTLANLVCGVLAISYVVDGVAAHAIARVGVGAAAAEAAALGAHKFVMAGWLILAGMACDGLDGRVARITRSTTSFGGMLDSLADVVTFGVAPAMIAKALMEAPLEFAYDRTSFLTAAFFALCACLRLARYSAEHDDPDSDGVTHFSGLPTPGAAGVVAGIAILHGGFIEQATLSPQALTLVAYILGFGVLVPLGLLMVSRVKYMHAANRLLSQRRTVGSVAILVLAVMVMLHLSLAHVLASLFAAYAVSGPCMVVWRSIRGRRRPRLPEIFD